MTKVLIVEDEPDYANIITQLLEPEGFKLATAATAKEALNLLEMVKPDLMIVDWNLPDRTGLELVKEVRAQKKFRKLRIIMNTIRDSENDQISAYMEEVDMYFTKPIKPAIFIEKIKKLLA